MTKTNYPATLLCDFYKVSHKQQYPKGTEVIYSTWTPRSNKFFPNSDKVVTFGIQAFVKKYLINYFNENFFNKPLGQVLSEYKRVLRFTLGIDNPDASHIEELHELGYLPIRLNAIKEGTLVPMKVPMLTMENTHPNFFWVTNYLETLISNEIWLPMTSATIAHTYRSILDEYAMKTTGNTDGVDFQGHDFSMRGMASLDASKASGAGHLLSFTGTDTIPAIMYHEEFYNANIENELVGASIPATEHSVMSANTDSESRDEFEMYKRLITEVYPNGLFSVVSDTYDLWAVIGDILPRLKDEIMNRDGKVVIRPDSGDPVDIICGNANSESEIVQKGLIEALWDIFGGTVTEQGYKVLDSHIGAIYGDSITIERAKAICERLEAKGFASTNIVLGVGSFSYQMNTRDTFGFAMKATYAVVNGEEKLLFKDPKTDDGTKKSQRGRVVTVQHLGEMKYHDGLYKEDEKEYKNTNLLETVFEDGKLLRDQSLGEIREILKNQR